MFKKIQKIIDTSGFDSERSRGELVKQYGPLKYYELNSTNPSVDSFISTLTIKPTGIRWVEANAGSTILPHIDHGIICALNIYVNGGSAGTNFWRPKEGEQPYSFKGETLKNMYEFKQLENSGSFTACDGSIYVLDVTKIHSVHNPKTMRTFIQLNWSHTSFKAITEMMDKI